MEVLLMTTQPSCFGTKHWDPNHPECIGGLDPVYQNPRDQTNRRDKCNWFEACRQRVAMGPIAQPSPLIPAHSLVGRSTMDPPKPSYAPYTPPRPPAYQQQPYQPQPYQPPMVQTPVATAPPVWQPQHQPMMVPQGYVYQYYSGSQVPHYLSVPEPIRDDISWKRRFLHEVGRALLKSLGQSFASFFDSNPMTRHLK
jgi:hypothetical protein